MTPGRPRLTRRPPAAERRQKVAPGVSPGGKRSNSTQPRRGDRSPLARQQRTLNDQPPPLTSNRSKSGGMGNGTPLPVALGATRPTGSGAFSVNLLRETAQGS